jgi:hypothetical protein
MTRHQINLQTAARQGFPFAIVSNAIWLGCGSNVGYIVSKHKSMVAAQRAFNLVRKNWVGDKSDVKLVQIGA